MGTIIICRHIQVEYAIDILGLYGLPLCYSCHSCKYLKKRPITWSRGCKFLQHMACHFIISSVKRYVFRNNVLITKNTKHFFIKRCSSSDYLISNVNARSLALYNLTFGSKPYPLFRIHMQNKSKLVLEEDHFEASFKVFIWTKAGFSELHKHY